jgi:tetratricopeptide (TPR) repeat protein
MASTVSTVVCMLLLVVGNLAQSQRKTAEDLLNEAYGILPIDRVAAMHLFERAIALSPNNVQARKQLGYLYLDANLPSRALEQFRSADSLEPSESTKLQIAYTLRTLGRSRESENAFRSLEASRDSSVRSIAQQERLAVSETPLARRPSHWWTHLYAAPYYDTRWKTSFVFAHVQQGLSLTDDKLVSLYGKISYSGDTKSKGGLIPAVFSDNALVFGLGVRLQPITGVLLDVQEGLAFDMIDRGTGGNKPRGDFRAVATLGYGIYPPYTFHPDFRMPFYPFIDLYASAGYYSRYKNSIGSVQLRAGLRPLEVANTVADVYTVGSIVLDTEHEFYNNLVEGGIGARFTPHVGWGLHVAAEYRRGMYLDVSDIATARRVALYDRAYESFRFFVIFERSL